MTDTLDSDAAELAEQIANELFGGILPVGCAPQIACAVAQVCCVDRPAPAVAEFLESLIIALQARMVMQEAKWNN